MLAEDICDFQFGPSSHQPVKAIHYALEFYLANV